MPDKLKAIQGEVDIPFPEETKQNIFDHPTDCQDHPEWSSHIKELTTAVRAHVKWQKLILAMLDLFGFPKERTWILRLDTVMAAAAFHAFSYDDVIAAAQDAAFPAAEGEDPGQPDEDFVTAFSKCLNFAIQVASNEAIPQIHHCPKCKAYIPSASV